MNNFTIAIVAALSATAYGFRCTNLTVPVSLSARNVVFNITTPQNNVEVTNLILDLTRQGGSFVEQRVQGYAAVHGNYSLAATYCTAPQTSTDQTALTILTHGLGFDHSYWDLPYNGGNYSYSAVATDRYGYATLSWDRLGVGMSSHGEPINEIQAWLEVDGLRALTEGLRHGSIKGVPRFEKVLHVGHSFGSTHVYALTAMYPNISDGIALTGFSQNGSFVPYFALGANFVDVKTIPLLAPQYDHGYLATGDLSAFQANFLGRDQCDPAILAFAATIGQPLAIGEILTIGSEIASLNTFRGPVLVLTGEHDVPFCGGSCYNGASPNSSIPAQSQEYWTNTRISTIIVPGAGHALNLEYSHPFTYKSINEFFDQNDKS
ncbi:hypothetical protein LTR17_002929 [Elasticomyces elasticus]|nr:hypothetical protein LTR17_002929 [Elasticomyces elasticus]